jgi:hypothetical protein
VTVNLFNSLLAAGIMSAILTMAQLSIKHPGGVAVLNAKKLATWR